MINPIPHEWMLTFWVVIAIACLPGLCAFAVGAWRCLHPRKEFNETGGAPHLYKPGPPKPPLRPLE